MHIFHISKSRALVLLCQTVVPNLTARAPFMGAMTFRTSMLTAILNFLLFRYGLRRCVFAIQRYKNKSKVIKCSSASINHLNKWIAFTKCRTNALCTTFSPKSLSILWKFNWKIGSFRWEEGYGGKPTTAVIFHIVEPTFGVQYSCLKAISPNLLAVKCIPFEFICRQINWRPMFCSFQRIGSSQLSMCAARMFTCQHKTCMQCQSSRRNVPTFICRIY